MEFEFSRPEAIVSSECRPLLTQWLRTEFRAMLVKSKSPLFQIWEVYYHLPDEVREEEGEPDRLPLSRHLRAAGYEKVARVRESRAERRIIWTAAFAGEYRKWPPKALAKEARRVTFTRSTPDGDRRLIAKLSGPQVRE